MKKFYNITIYVILAALLGFAFYYGAKYILEFLYLLRDILGSISDDAS